MASAHQSAAHLLVAQALNSEGMRPLEAIRTIISNGQIELKWRWTCGQAEELMYQATLWETFRWKWCDSAALVRAQAQMETRLWTGLTQHWISVELCGSRGAYVIIGVSLSTEYLLFISSKYYFGFVIILRSLDWAGQLK